MAQSQRVDLYGHIVAANRGRPPVVLKVGVQQEAFYTDSGTVNAPVTNENYILLSALPDELRERVTQAVKVILSGI